MTGSIPPIIDLAEERRRRERFLIALAGSVHELIHADPDDPTPLGYALEMLAREYREVLTDHDIDLDYRAVLAWHRARPGGVCDPTAPDLERFHAGALAWARGIVVVVRESWGVDLLAERPA